MSTTGVMHPGTMLLDAVIAASKRESWGTPTATVTDNEGGVASFSERSAKLVEAGSRPLSMLLPMQVAVVEGSEGAFSVEPTTDAGERTPALNPRWVEMLMGFPQGWVEPPEGEVIDHTVKTKRVVAAPAPPAVEPFPGFPAPPNEPQRSYEPRRAVPRPARGPTTAATTALRKLSLYALGNAVVPQCAQTIGDLVLALADRPIHGDELTEEG